MQANGRSGMAWTMNHFLLLAFILDVRFLCLACILSLYRSWMTYEFSWSASAIKSVQFTFIQRILQFWPKNHGGKSLGPFLRGFVVFFQFATSNQISCFPHLPRTYQQVTVVLCMCVCVCAFYRVLLLWHLKEASRSTFRIHSLSAAPIAKRTWKFIQSIERFYHNFSFSPILDLHLSRAHPLVRRCYIGACPEFCSSVARWKW